MYLGGSYVYERMDVKIDPEVEINGPWESHGFKGILGINYMLSKTWFFDLQASWAFMDNLKDSEGDELIFDFPDNLDDDGEIENPLPPPGPGSDPRSTAQLREILEKKFNSRKPKSWTRKQLWHALKDYEDKAARDAVTNPPEESNKFPFKSHCGFAAKTKAGVVAHERNCKKCQELKSGNTS